MQALDYYGIRLKHPSVVTHSDVLDFRHYLGEFEIASTGEDSDDLQALSHLVTACGHVVEPESRDKLAALPIGAVGDAGSLYGLAVDYLDLLAALAEIIADPESVAPVYWVAPDGTEFECRPAAWGKHLSGQPALTVAEVVETLALEAVTPRPGDTPALRSEALDQHFTLSLKQLAVLLREPGEPLPLDEAERDDFLVERGRLFSQVPHAVAVRTLAALRNFTTAASRPTPAPTSSRSGSREPLNRKAARPLTTSTAPAAQEKSAPTPSMPP